MASATSRDEKNKRLNSANQLLDVISRCGRNFFRYKDHTAYFELSQSGKVFFIDSYTKKRIYTHSKFRWNGFTNGGTLRRFIESLRDYIVK